MKQAQFERALLSDDGREVIIECSREDERIMLNFSPESLQAAVHDIGGLLLQAATKSNPRKSGFVHATTPRRYSAARTDDGLRVIVAFQMQNLLEHSFALHPKDAEGLGRRMVDEATKQIRPASVAH